MRLSERQISRPGNGMAPKSMPRTRSGVGFPVFGKGHAEKMERPEAPPLSQEGRECLASVPGGPE